MRRRTPRTRARGLAAAFSCALAVASIAPRVHAGACCGTGQSIALRLAPSEIASVGLHTGARWVRGHWDASGRYVPATASDRELRVEARAMFKLGAAQFGAIVPYLRTDRRFDTASGSGHGVGDVTLLSRYDFVRVGGQNGIPGIAFTLAGVLPTGRPTDRAKDALGADATGSGSFEVRPGLAIEKSWWTGWFALAAFGVGVFAPDRRADGTTVTLGPRFYALFTGGKSFSNGLGLALGVSHEHEEGPRVDGVRVSGVRAKTSALWFASYEIDDHVQLYFSVIVDPPFRSFGRDQLADFTLGFGIRRAWNVY